MIRAIPEKSCESLFYANVPQSAWACLAALLVQKKFEGFTKSAECKKNSVGGSSSLGGGEKVSVDTEIFGSADIFGDGKKIVVLCMESFSDCEYFYSKLKYFLELSGVDANVKLLPPIPTSADAKYFDAVCERIGTVNDIAQFSGDCGLGQVGGSSDLKKLVLLTTPAALADSMHDDKIFQGLSLSRGDKLDPESLRLKLVEFGYYNEPLCELPGQFSVRGGVLDIYPVSAEQPVRLDFFGDELEEIRTFNPDTQLSDGKLSSVRIDAVPENMRDESEDGDESSVPSFSVFDLICEIPSDWIFFEPHQLVLKNSDLFSTFESGISKKSFARIFANKNNSFCAISSLDLPSEVFISAARAPFKAEGLSEYSDDLFDEKIGVERFDSERAGRMEFARSLSNFAKSGFDIFISAENLSDREMIADLFKDANADFSKCSFIEGNFGDGFIISDFGSLNASWKIRTKNSKGAAFVSAPRLLGRRVKPALQPRRKMFSRRAQVDQLLDFSELGEGDYVVHYGHGICRYHGVAKLDTNGAMQEFLKLEFEDEAYLYLPLHECHLLGRYIGLDKRTPKLSKLDSKSWTKIRTAAEHAALDYAAELLETQSKREVAKGFAFESDDRWQQSFDESFPFAETPDQLRAIAEVKADMQSDLPMERLLCADVGFGKTEVAMRAAFKAAMSGKQTAILCPTTILSQQHFRNFRERFSGYPIVIEMLSRFRTRGEAAQIKSQLAAGKIDIIIGTHALLSSDVEFKDLGLLVIDEEHRFGVKHKEKIKRLRQHIDVLSMSATPIPRTLYFAMMGARKISLMETPPKDRFPVETMVREYSDDIVRSAIDTEISRGGQIFYLHNRVKSIEETARKLREMFPSLRIGVGHGQMSELALERLMADFVDGKYDILVCTTIIESGLDIPNCNTIIIEGADKFGLAQLYQLRGRVGRFTRRAYAWLLLHRHAVLVESARKRLGAIRQYNKPGAGFRIATRDLQLRGCGNLLGAKQSGHIAGVGFDLYCSLLKKSIALLKGEQKAYWVRARVALDFIVLGEGAKSENTLSNAETIYQELKMKETFASSVDTAKAYIPEAYIPQTQLRVDLYRKLSQAVSLKEVEDIAAQTDDRFGAVPEAAQILFFLARIRILAESAQLIAVESEGGSLKLRLNSESKTEHFRINGRFPRLKQTSAVARLKEIEHFLTHTLPSIRKI